MKLVPIRLALAFALVASSVSCTTAPSGDAVAGTWVLSTLNSVPLPYPYASNYRLTVDKYVLPGDGTFIRYITRQYDASGGSAPQPGGSASETEEGTYVTSGTSISFFRPINAHTRVGTLDGNTLKVSESGDYVYKRQ